MALGYASLTQPTENTKQSMFHSSSGAGRYRRGTEVTVVPVEGQSCCSSPARRLFPVQEQDLLVGQFFTAPFLGQKGVGISGIGKGYQAEAHG